MPIHYDQQEQSSARRARIYELVKREAEELRRVGSVPFDGYLDPKLVSFDLSVLGRMPKGTSVGMPSDQQFEELKSAFRGSPEEQAADRLAYNQRTTSDPSRGVIFVGIKPEELELP